jgi:hypothetical protein
MKRVVWFVVLLTAVLMVAPMGVLHSRNTTLRTQVTQDLEQARKRVVARSPPTTNALHDDGFHCLAGLLDVAPKSFSPFDEKPDARLLALFSGQHPELVDATMRERLLLFSPWVKSLRECSHSARLTFTSGLTPWDSPTLRNGQLSHSMVALFRFTNVEVQALLTDGQVSTALERCTETLQLGTDLTHLGIQGSALLRVGLRTIVPLCATALAASEPEVKAQVAKQWAALPARLATTEELVDDERLASAVLGFGWSAGLPGAKQPEVATWNERVGTQLLWRRHDQAMRKLHDVAATPGPARTAASEKVVDSFQGWMVAPQYVASSLQYEPFLVGEEENGEVLSLLLALALGDENPHPHVTRGDGFVTFQPSNADPLVIPTRALKN